MRKLIFLLSFFAASFSHSQTAEYQAGRFLSPINANSAYLRGYTGAGSTILIIDTGINFNSPEFKNKILNSIDYTGTGILDKVGHGSNVASIAAAAQDGKGMMGVAYDANLLIAKVTNNNSYNFSNALRAIQWGGSQGAIVANISANVVSNANYISYTKQISPGVYQNTHPVYGGTNYYNLEKPSDWANALKGNNIILVVSAGNSGRAYPDNPATFATATDADGNLMLGGRMLIVGNWDQLRNRPHITSNLAGTICKNVANGACQDQYRISDFYIMAPGTANYGVSANGYVGMTGTSQATPVVAGAVAIINQMWPNMKPENIVQLLLVTANKNIPNYNPATMGQGLLDLNRATQPIGVLTIPTTGRVGVGGVIATPLITSGSASLAKISSVMVLDSFERDFYTTGRSLTIAQPVTEFNPAQSSMPYRTHNSYSLFNNYIDSVASKAQNIEMKMYFDGRSNNHMIEIGRKWEYDKIDFSFSGGGFQETGSWLGSSGTSNSYTTYSHMSITNHLSDSDRIFGTVGYGVTSANFNNGLFTLGSVQSYTWNVGVEHDLDDKQTVGLMLNQPVTVVNTSTTVNVPVGMDSQGAIQFNQQRVSLTPDVKELRLGAYYKTNNVVGYVERRQNYLGQSGIYNDVVGVVANFSF
jgi:hypothetical protein